MSRMQRRTPAWTAETERYDESERGFYALVSAMLQSSGNPQAGGVIKHYCCTTIDAGSHWDCTILVGYEYIPGERPIYDYRNGGHPGARDQINILWVIGESGKRVDWALKREQLEQIKGAIWRDING